MNKADFIKEVAVRTGYTQKAVKEVIGVISDVTLEHLTDEDGVSFLDGMKFGSKMTGERTGINPQTGAKLVIPAHLKPYCKFGKAVKEALA